MHLLAAVARRPRLRGSKHQLADRERLHRWGELVVERVEDDREPESLGPVERRVERPALVVLEDEPSGRSGREPRIPGRETVVGRARVRHAGPEMEHDLVRAVEAEGAQ